MNKPSPIPPIWGVFKTIFCRRKISLMACRRVPQQYQQYQQYTSARLPHVAIEAKNLSQHQEELWEGRENADELPSLPCRRPKSGLRTDFGRWGTWDVEAIGIESYWFMFQTTKWPTMGWWKLFLNIFFTWDFWNSKWDNFTWLLHNYPWPAFGVLCFPTLLPAVPL